MRMISRLAVAVLALGIVALGSVSAQAPTKDIVDTAVGAGQFKTLVEAVKAAELVGTLKGKGPFTVFAPTDEAFKKIPADKLQELLKDKKALAEILTYHVVPGKVMAADAIKLDGKAAKTAQGGEVKITVADGKVKLNGSATVIKADIETTNGVIHVIDTVIMPSK